MRSLAMGVGRSWVVAFALAVFAVGAFGCKKSGSGNPDASDGGVLEGGITDGPKKDGGDGPDGACPTGQTGTKAPGDACRCNSECGSRFCVDGVCCSTACTEGCKTCNSAGTCVNRQSGEDPRDASTCVKMPATTCGLDGKCDGTGGCRKYEMNVTCKPG